MAAPSSIVRSALTYVLRCSSCHTRRHWEVGRQPCAFLAQQRVKTPYRTFSTSPVQQATDAAEEERPLKPPNMVAWHPADDVYHIRYYPWYPDTFEEALQQMRDAANLEFLKPDSNVHIALELDMKLEKKKKVEPFIGSVILPHAITDEQKKILVFATEPEDVEEARNCGAHIVGGLELVQEILQDKLDFDYCVAVPRITTDLQILKKKLQKRFPKKKRNTVGLDIPFMVDLWSRGQEYAVLTHSHPKQEGKGHIDVPVGKLYMSDEQLTENIDCMIKAICTHKPLSFGTFVTRAMIRATMIPATGTPCYKFHVEPFLPEEPKDEFA